MTVEQTASAIAIALFFAGLVRWWYSLGPNGRQALGAAIFLLATLVAVGIWGWMLAFDQAIDAIRGAGLSMADEGRARIALQARQGNLFTAFALDGLVMAISAVLFRANRWRWPEDEGE